MAEKYYKDLPDGKYIDKDGDILTIKNGKFNWSCWVNTNKWYEVEYYYKSKDEDKLIRLSIKSYYNL
jgi:hypothetical protein